MLMGPGGPIIVLFAIVMATAIIITWIRSNRPGPRRDASSVGMAQGGDMTAERQIELLSTENAGLKGKVSRLEERLAVLERIVTDPAERTARDIESLR